MKSSIHPTCAASIALLCAPAFSTAMQLPGFELIDETEQIQHASTHASTVVIRTIQLPSGDRIQLIHTLTPEGLLELDVSAQSTQTLDALERYCDAALPGATLRRSARMVGTREGVALPACGGSGQLPAIAGEPEPRHTTSR